MEWLPSNDPFSPCSQILGEHHGLLAVPCYVYDLVAVDGFAFNSYNRFKGNGSGNMVSVFLKQSNGWPFDAVTCEWHRLPLFLNYVERGIRAYAVRWLFE